MPPFSHELALSIMEAELGRPVDEVFTDLSPQPIAAASLAQVGHDRQAETVGYLQVMVVTRQTERRHTPAAWLLADLASCGGDVSLFVVGVQGPPEGERRVGGRQGAEARHARDRLQGTTSTGQQQMIRRNNTRTTGQLADDQEEQPRRPEA